MTIEELHKYEADQDAIWEAIGMNCECGCNKFQRRSGAILCIRCFSVYHTSGWTLTKPTPEEYNPNVKSLQLVMNSTKFNLIRIT
jgi:hypothetical protein